MACEKICMIEDCKRRLTFDGSSMHRGDGATNLLYVSDGMELSLLFKLEFHCSNNEIEYATLIVGSISTSQIGISRVYFQDNSKLSLNRSMRICNKRNYLSGLLNRGLEVKKIFLKYPIRTYALTSQQTC